MKPLRIIIAGASGRMGRLVAALSSRDRRFKIAGALIHDRPLGFKAPSIHSAELPRALLGADVLVDFSAPAASLLIARQAAILKKPCVIGTTGFSKKEMAMLRRLSRSCAIFYAPNFSRGVAAARRASRVLAEALNSYEVRIEETHHRFKKDKPSGTALALQSEIAGAMGPAPIKSRRIGDVVGEHRVLFSGPFETLEIVHRAGSRNLFAQGALEAALWVAGRRPGFYGMDDMVGAGGFSR